MILDGERIAERMLVAVDGPRSYLLGFYPEARIPPERERDQLAEPLAAKVNHGVWIVSCDCGSEGEPAPGMVAWLSVPWAWCIRCENRAAGGKWRRVAAPPPDERAVIEAVLDCRREIGDRNWSPGETVAELRADNLLHDERVPEEV